ncbi:glutathione S-transferase family protein [Shewanella sp. JM162201]|uniref:Glutathione S-transferase family protein n=1 Tax=Shewanella jiangmenensis TaxID=2837387 RepID=A0ABS5V5P9_9GAMM|nr:glutathione S-transferase family protein [Shewanella jiangmenensis]MBT1445136.1 glutathione S-transferase family protein [Shewanella jiangmenensis]
MELFYHPLSRYSQKVLLGMYEKQANFYPRVTDLRDPLQRQAFSKLNPLGKLPLLRCSDGSMLPESSIIIEYLDRHIASGSRLLPPDADDALRVRLWDRIIDNDISNQLFLIEQQQSMAPEHRNELAMAQVRQRLLLVFAGLDNELAHSHWLVGDGFSLADCALLPCLEPAFTLLPLLDLDNLCRYRQQAKLRGSWELVAEEAQLAAADDISGVKLIP